MFIGFVTLGTQMSFLVQSTSSGEPADADTLPGYRVYHDGGLATNGTGTLTQPESGSITGATNASPIVITSASHGLTTNQKVTIASVGGNTAANGAFVITKVDANTFSLNGSTGNGGYTSGGTWKTTGLYVMTFTPSQVDGFAQGAYYDIFVNYAISSVAQVQQFRFGVI